MSAEDIRVAIIGTGGIAHSHAQEFKAQEGVSVVACCDLSKKAARGFATHHGIAGVYTDVEAMLAAEDVTAVSVTASDAAHCPLSLAAIKHGAHVLCEKPMAVDLKEARRMQAAARRKGVVGMINFSHRVGPAVDAARGFIEEGRLGRIMHVEASYLQSWLNGCVSGGWKNAERLLWRMSQKHHGGTLNDIGCHILDLTVSLVGGIQTVSCASKCFDKGVPKNHWKGYTLDADDTFFATAEFANGALGTIHATRWATGYSNKLAVRVFGDKGALELEANNGAHELRVCFGEFHAQRFLWTPVPVAAPKLTTQRRFVQAIRAGRSESPSFEDGVRNLAIMEACRRSAREGKPVRVEDKGNL